MVRYRQAAKAGAGPNGGLRRTDREPRRHPSANSARPTAQGGVQASRVEWFHVAALLNLGVDVSSAPRPCSRARALDSWRAADGLPSDPLALGFAQKQLDED